MTNTLKENFDAAEAIVKAAFTRPADDKPDIAVLYAQERKAGWPAKQAFRRARTFAAWECLGGYLEYQASNDDGVNTQTPTVRLVISEDPEGYDLSYIDSWDDVTETERAKIQEEIQNRISFEGVVIVCAEWWNGEEWEHADSISGFIGNEWQGSGYDVDLMQAAMDDYAKPLYGIEIAKGYYEISADRDELMTACNLFDEDPEEIIFTMARASLAKYSKVDACIYRKEG